MRKRLIAGNWKLNGDPDLCQAFAAYDFPADGCEVVVCPPSVFIAQFAAQVLAQKSALRVGAQNVAATGSGAYTGEVSAEMLQQSGADYCIVGHSERRALFDDTDASIAAKVELLLKSSICPIICVGEDCQTRDAGLALSFVENQLATTIGHISAESKRDLSNWVVAYEPVWAIGSGKAASTEQIQEMHAYIRQTLARYGEADRVRLLYGGSVSPDNASEILELVDVDGALIGGASLRLAQFAAIAEL